MTFPRTEDVGIDGHAQRIPLRLYRAEITAEAPAILYFHGGGFRSGNLNDADLTASHIAQQTGALVVSVGYSLSPEYPFPAALEDGYRATEWLIARAGEFDINPARLGVAGDDAGGSLATGLAMAARDRGEFRFAAQALLAPLLDPSMTRLGDDQKLGADMNFKDCADCYRAYLPTISQRLHPYAAPIESRRLAGVPPILIASAQHDILHVEAEKYAAALIAAGVHTEITRYAHVSHHTIAAHTPALNDVASFFTRRLSARTEATLDTQSKEGIFQ
jgi:acetyl esterase